jgi:zinc protease
MLLACTEPRGARVQHPARVPSFMARQPSLGAPEAFAFPVAARLHLSGGMQGLLVERHDLPIVTLRVVVLSGTAQGVALPVAQMIDEGAGSRSALEVSSDLLQIGASLTTDVRGDISTVGLRVLRPRLDTGLDILADVIMRPRFLAKEWTRVRGDLLSRALQRRAQPAHVAQIALKAVVYGDHPYGRPTLPLPGDLEQLGVDELRRYYRAHYRPENIVIVAAGAVTARELEEKLNARFGAWPRGTAAAASSPVPSAPPTRPPRLALLARAGATQSVLRVGALGPARRDADYAALRVLNTLFGGSFTSRLNVNLREKHGFTYGAHSSFTLPRDAGLFTVRASVDTANTVAALREISNELQALLDQPPRADEVDKAKQLVVEELPGLAESLDGLAEAYTEVGAYGLPLDTYARLAAEVSAVTPERIYALARKLVRPEQAAIVVVGDLKKIAEPLRQVYGRALRLDADGQPVRVGAAPRRARPAPP